MAEVKTALPEEAAGTGESNYTPLSSDAKTLSTSDEGRRSSTGANQDEAPALTEARRLLKELYEIHDFFFTADKADKKEMLKSGCAKVMAQLERFGEGSTTRERASVAFIRGRALDVFEAFDREAEAALSKAVKLEPSDIEAWNALGHCFWKKGDLQGALNCYQEALQKRANKDSLRQLSMVLRQLPAKTYAEAQKNVQESLRRAKEAVKLDVKDPESWYVLGNGYTTLFFKGTHAMADLDRALQAYQQAEANGGESNPDLFYNKANVLRYKEDMSQAAEAFRKAADLDPALKGHEELEGIVQRATRTVDMLDKKGRMKEKRLQALVASLADVKPPTDNSRKKDNNAKCDLVSIEQLSIGANEGKAVALKLIMPVGQLNHPPNSFIMADKTCRCVVLSIYHIDQEACHRLGEKDTFVVLNPYLKRVNCTLTHASPSPAGDAQDKAVRKGAKNDQEDGEGGNGEQQQRTYDSIQVLEPTSLLINGKVINSAHVSPAVIRLDHFDV